MTLRKLLALFQEHKKYHGETNDSGSDSDLEPNSYIDQVM